MEGSPVCPPSECPDQSSPGDTVPLSSRTTMAKSSFLTKQLEQNSLSVTPSFSPTLLAQWEGSRRVDLLPEVLMFGVCVCVCAHECNPLPHATSSPPKKTCTREGTCHLPSQTGGAAYPHCRPTCRSVGTCRFSCIRLPLESGKWQKMIFCPWLIPE